MTGLPVAAPAAAPEGIARPPAAFYVHVPFCASVCPYCDFVVYGGASARGPRSRVSEYLRALHVELELRATRLDERFGPPGSAVRPSVDTVYLGGGTPSLLPAAEVAGILDAVVRRFGLAANAEVTLESNPGPDERGDLAGFRAAGVTRISFGAQSLDAGELQRLGRRHRPADVAAAVAEARTAGIASLSLDLLYDLPGQTLSAWTATLDAALALAPDHLSLYALTLDDPDAEGLTGPSGDHLPTSSGARRWRQRARSEQDDDVAALQYLEACDRLAAAGFSGYEISNWARPGHESRHNLAYWERRPYEAVGVGAHAFDGIVRRWNAARLEGYLAALLPTGAMPPALPPGGAEILDAATAAAESVILGLRTSRGVTARFADTAPFAEALRWAVEQGIAVRTPDERIVLTARGRLLSNELFARLV
jgi:oxygen-independent coproporphyrinogen-3 oxidase